MPEILERLKRVVYWARTTKTADDSRSRRVQQVTYHKTGNAMPVYPYGFHAVAPEDQLGLAFAVGANADNRAIIVTSENRPDVTDSDGGTVGVAMYHPVTGARVVMRSNGRIEITAPDRVTINAPRVRVVSDRVDVLSDDVRLGTGMLEKLMNLTAMLVYNSHTHGGSSNMPNEQMVEGTDTTDKTTAN